MYLIQKEKLAEALTGFRLLNRKKGRSAEPLYITIRPEQNAMQLSASRLGEALIYRSPGEPDGLASKPLAVPMASLEEAARAADQGSAITIENASLRYRIKGTFIKADFESPTQQPETPSAEFPGQDTVLSVDVMTSIVEASSCASTDESREVLNGVHLGLERLAATDGRRLYTRKIDPLPVSEEGIILPVHPLLRLFAQKEVGLRLAPPAKNETRRFELTQGPWAWVGNLVRGTYPNYMQILPTDDENRQWLDLADSDALRILDILPKLPGAKEKDSPVRLELKEGKAALVIGANGSRNEVSLPGSRLPGDGKPEEVTFNRDFLLEALRQGFRKLGLKDRFAPIVMEDPSTHRTHVWMPLRTEEQAKAAQSTNQPEEASPAAPDRSVPEEAKPSAPIERIHPQPTAAMNDTQPEAEVRDPVEVLIEDIQTVRDSLKETVTKMNGLVPLVRQVARENKGMEKELNKARSSFASLERSVKALSQIAV